MNAWTALRSIRGVRSIDASARLAKALLAEPDARHFGYDLMREAHTRSSTIYPLLARFMEAGFLRDGWESSAETRGQRPPRRFYEVTEQGLRELPTIVALSRATTGKGLGL